jgi:hypothetical protein
MRHFGIMVLFLFSSSCWAVQFPGADGTYAGTGSLTRLNGGTRISYDVVTTLSSAANTISLHYHYANGVAYTLSYQLVDDNYGTFTLNAGGAAAGSGFCITNVCQVDLNYTDAVVGPLNVKMSYTFNGNEIVATGRNYSTGTIFQEASSLQK